MLIPEQKENMITDLRIQQENTKKWTRKDSFNSTATACGRAFQCINTSCNQKWYVEISKNKSIQFW